MVAGFGAQHLNGDLARESRILRAIDNTHPALAKLIEDPIPSDESAIAGHRVAWGQYTVRLSDGGETCIMQSQLFCRSISFNSSSSRWSWRFSRTLITK